MQVDGINQPNGHAYGLQKQQQEEPEVEETTTESSEPTGEESNGEQEKGVIGLLQEGHFKGVSDVRLRINFFDELAGIETAQKQAAAEENVNGILESVGGVVESFLGENELTEEQTAGVSEAHDGFVQAVNAAGDDTTADLNNAFEGFVDLLENLLALAPDPAPWESLIENLQASFTEAMDEFTNELNSVSALPELSEPSGNGVAYEKFLAIYNEMRGIEPVSQVLDEPEPPEEPE